MSTIEDITMERWEHAGFICRIVVDQEPGFTPRENADSPSTLVTSSRLDTGIGDETYDPDSLDRTIHCPTCEGYGEIDNPAFDPDEREGDEESSTVETAMIDCPNEACDNGTVYLPTLADKLRAEIGEGCVLVPLRYADYGSSGAQLYEASDDDFNAYIYADAETVEREWGGQHNFTEDAPTTPQERARSFMLGEVEELHAYLSGEVYGFMVGTEGEPHMDSCWGFFGLGEGEGSNKSTMIAEANSVAEHLREQADKEAAEVAEWAARDVMTV